MSLEVPTVIPHAGSATRLPVNVRLFVAALAGFGAAALTAVGVDRLDEGATTLTFLVAAVTGATPEDVTPRSRTLFTYALGMVLGLLFEGFVVGYEAVRPAIVRFVDVLSLADVAAAAVVVLVMYAPVAYLVFPRYRETCEVPQKALRRTWLAVSVTYAVSLLVVVPLAYLLLPVAN